MESTSVDNLAAATAFATENAARFETQLFDLLRIPSVSTQSDHDADCDHAARWLADDMQRIGLENIEVFPTGEHAIVYGDWLHAGLDAQTVVIYGHYDVQPADPLEEWNTPPFEPTIADDGVTVHARGAADDKGQLFIHLKAVESCLADSGSLPVNVKFVLEGDEESGSTFLEGFIQENSELLAGDVCLISDSHMLSESQPSLILSLRGMTYCEIHVDGPAQDLHSGTFGGAIRNPAETLANIIAQLKDNDGRITIPGFYDDVKPLTDSEREDLERVGFNDEAFMREAGVDATFGEYGYTVYEQVGARPTLEVNGIWGGYSGEGAKTVLPARAGAKISMRLVANQRWEKIAKLFESYVKYLAPSGCTVTVKSLHGGEPSHVDASAPALKAATRALEKVFDTTPVLTREGGSIPVVNLFESILNMPTVLMGFGLPDDRLHSPNEKFSLTQFRRGIQTSITFLHEL